MKARTRPAAPIEMIVIGASAGGLDGVQRIVKQLPASFPACVAVVIHNNGRSHLPAILARVSELPVVVPESGDAIVPGRIVIAPQDHHLLVSERTFMLHQGPRENGFRPAIDPLFRTAARAYGNRVMGILLSGAQDDGTYGMHVIKNGGGLTVVQHPDEAAVPSMPLSAIANVEVDHVATISAIVDLMTTLTGPTSRKGNATMAPAEPLEPQDPENPTPVRAMIAAFGPPSGITCPDCNGALWEIREGQLVRYRCHVGHQYSPERLEAGQSDAVEGALWSAVRALEEQADLRQRMAERAHGSGLDSVRARFSDAAHESHRQAASIRELLFGRTTPPEEAVSVQQPHAAARRGKVTRATKTAARGRRTNGR